MYSHQIKERAPFLSIWFFVYIFCAKKIFLTCDRTGKKVFLPLCFFGKISLRGLPRFFLSRESTYLNLELYSTGKVHVYNQIFKKVCAGKFISNLFWGKGVNVSAVFIAAEFFLIQFRKKLIRRMLFFPVKTHKTTLFGFFLDAETHREMACRRYKIYRTCTLFSRTCA